MPNRMYIENDEELGQYIEEIYNSIKKKYPNITKKQVRYFIYLLLKTNDIKTKINIILNKENETPFSNDVFKIK